MFREISEKLLKWKDSSRRKPLLITGVRQCGKTYSIKSFGENHFENMVYINFESSSKYGAIFEYDFDTERIVNEIELVEKGKITPGRTLLIFDEIQECPRAITSLKYFCENMRELHIVCAGSLLGVALKRENISFPVGKVNRMQMYPMNFKEFAIASGAENYIRILSDWQCDREIPDLYTVPLKKLLGEYSAVGGMPEAVAEWISSRDSSAVDDIQQDILSDYEDDFSKHAPVAEIEKIRLIWKSIPLQLAKENNKFVFSHVQKGKRAHELEAALQWLSNAGLVHIHNLIENTDVPLSAHADLTYFKVFMSDVGLLRKRAGISFASIINGDNNLNGYKGALAENYVLCELLSQDIKSYFWRSGNTAEVDMVFEHESDIYPVEVKSADNARAKSYKLFCSRYSPERGFKVSLKNIGVNDCEGTETLSIPLYMTWRISSELNK